MLAAHLSYNRFAPPLGGPAVILLEVGPQATLIRNPEKMQLFSVLDGTDYTMELDVVKVENIFEIGTLLIRIK